MFLLLNSTKTEELVYNVLSRAAKELDCQVYLIGGYVRDKVLGRRSKDIDIDKKVNVLSGGERTRLAMVKLLLEPVNFLILDEPTNHLDLKSKEVLKEALLNFDGTLILVSHDRDFLMGLSEKVFEFKDKRVIEHFETIDEFLIRNRMESLKEIEMQRNK